MLWLKDGGELKWSRLSELSDGVLDMVLTYAEGWVNEHTAQQLLDLHMPRLRGARRMYMALQEELVKLLPPPAGTWTPMAWEPLSEDELPRATGYYMVLQRSPFVPTHAPVKQIAAIPL